ncbi:MAG: hypothetical protein ACKOXN_14120, partial [Limnohabitans sp.]
QQDSGGGGQCQSQLNGLPRFGRQIHACKFTTKSLEFADETCINHQANSASFSFNAPPSFRTAAAFKRNDRWNRRGANYRHTGHEQD